VEKQGWTPDGYDLHHAAIRDARGTARTHECHFCLHPAAEWAWSGVCPDVQVGAKGKKWCPHLECYRALCRRCHHAYDAGIRAMRNPSGGNPWATPWRRVPPRKFVPTRVQGQGQGEG
jgi:hypothetical protein